MEKSGNPMKSQIDILIFFLNFVDV